MQPLIATGNPGFTVEWHVLSQVILWVPQLERGVSSSCRSGLLRKLYSTDLDVKCVFLQLCWDLREEIVSCVLMGDGVSYLLLGLWGNAGCYSQLCFLLVFTAQQGQFENVLNSEL